MIGWTPNETLLSTKPHEWSPRTWAYLGDAVYELIVRQQALQLGVSDPNQLHQWVTERVKASAQADILETLLPVLSDEELDMVRRGRNAPLAMAKGKDKTHHQASALETLVGYWYVVSPERLQLLLERHSEA